MKVNLYEVLTREQIRAFNTEVREQGKDLSRAERKELAVHFGVSQRQAERYLTTAGQQRGLIPMSAAGQAMTDPGFPAAAAQRIMLAAAITGGRVERPGNPASEGDRTLKNRPPPANIFGQVRQAQGLIMRGEQDRYLGETWKEIDFKGGQIGVTYEKVNTSDFPAWTVEDDIEDWD